MRSSPSSDFDPGIRRSVTWLGIALLTLGMFATILFGFVNLPALNEAKDLAQATRESLTTAAPVAIPESTPDELRQRLEMQQAAHITEIHLADENVDLTNQHVRRGWGRLGGLIASLFAIGYLLIFHRHRIRDRSQAVNAVTLLVMLVGITLLATRLLLQQAVPGIMVWGLADIIALQICVCGLMPVNVREGTVPFALLLLIWAVAFALPGASELDSLDRVVGIIMSPVLLLPGGVLANWRLHRRREDAERVRLGKQVDFLGGELSRARIVHDAMFPRPFSGHVTFEYEYQPIQEIGGDYVHAHRCESTGRVLVTLLDVAGHGLAAALTVNRLFGELERILAEDEYAAPGEIMTLLNRYIFLTMARHSLYATGTSMSLDPATGELIWANAGHPPSLLRSARNGEVSHLDTTSVLLGATPPDLFDPEEQTIALAPGDVVIAYTDGAFEARDLNGDCFGMGGVRDLAGFSPPPRSWPRFIAGAVAQHHGGNAEDDVLIAALTYASKRINVGVPTPEGAGAAAG